MAKFLGTKFIGVMSVQLILFEVEFNTLLISSLQSSRDDRRVIDIKKVATLSEQLRDSESVT